MSKQSSVAFRIPLALLLLAGVLASCEQEDVAVQEEVIRPVRAIRAGVAEQIERRALFGRAQASRQVSLEFRIPGEVATLSAAVGDKVSQGQLLAALDPDTYQAEVDRQRANLASAEARLANAEVEAERNATLFEREVVAQSSLDEAIASRDGARADVAAIQASLNRAELDLRYTRLEAPFDGLIVAKYVEVFEDVRANQPVIRLLDPSLIELVIDVPETLISQAGYARDIVVEFDAYPGIRVPAVISEIGSEASQTTRTYPVTLLMEQPEGATILPGMAGRVTGRAGGSKEEVTDIILPISAVFGGANAEESFVWVIDEERMSVHQRAVSLGVPTALGLVIESGVERGDLVVTAGVHNLTEAQIVRLLDLE